jgi:hypothetical protein
MPEWDSFLWSADEFIVSYTRPPHNLSYVKLFTIGHAVELHLKAAYTKITGDLIGALRFKHDIKAIWDACKGKNRAFMEEYDIRSSVLESRFLQSPVDIYKTLSNDDFDHLIENQELYTVAKVLPDLKVFSIGMVRKAPYSLSFVQPNDYWIPFLRTLRDFLGIQHQTLANILKEHTKRGRPLPSTSLSYLSRLYDFPQPARSGCRLTDAPAVA